MSKPVVMSVSRDGSKFHVETTRMIYDFEIGKSYVPRTKEVRGPKLLVDVIFLGDIWRAVVKAETEGERDRVLELDSFLRRYVEGKKKGEPKKIPVEQAPVSDRVSDPEEAIRALYSEFVERTTRIEAKVDRLLKDLGVTVQ